MLSSVWFPQAAPPAEEDDDDDIDLFGSDDEEATAEAERIKQERIDAYTAKKSTKPALIAKSNIILDVSGWFIVVIFCLVFALSIVRCHGWELDVEYSVFGKIRLSSVSVSVGVVLRHIAPLIAIPQIL